MLTGVACSRMRDPEHGGEPAVCGIRETVCAREVSRHVERARKVVHRRERVRVPGAEHAHPYLEHALLEPSTRSEVATVGEYLRQVSHAGKRRWVFGSEYASLCLHH